MLYPTELQARVGPITPFIININGDESSSIQGRAGLVGQRLRSMAARFNFASNL